MLTTLLPFVFLAAQEPVPPGQPEQLEELEPKTYEEAHYPLFGRQVSGVGDVDADGTPDILVADTGGWAEGHKGEVAGVFVLSGKDGSTLHAVFGRRPGEEFATSLRGAGDIDRDGHADWVVGVPDASGKTPGEAVVYSGKKGEELYRLRGAAPGDLFGWDVDGADDVDADGTPDVAVGAPGVRVDGQATGAIYVYSGATGELIYDVRGEAVGRFGTCVRGTGDVDDDGHADLAVLGSRREVITAHSVTVLSGHNGEPITVLTVRQRRAPTILSRVVDGDGARALLLGLAGEIQRVELPSGQARIIGKALEPNAFGLEPAFANESNVLHAMLGDVDGDGRADLLTGYPLGGYVQVLSGQTALPVLHVPFLNVRNDETRNFGAVADVIGDVNGDSYPDFVVGCDNELDKRPGRVWVFSGIDGRLLFAFRRVGGAVVVE